jgi:hypothetical protein
MFFSFRRPFGVFDFSDFPDFFPAPDFGFVSNSGAGREGNILAILKENIFNKLIMESMPLSKEY